MLKVLKEIFKMLAFMSLEIGTFIIILVLKHYTKPDESSSGFEMFTEALFSIAFGLSVKSYALNIKINNTLKARILSISEKLNKVFSVSELIGLIQKTFSIIENNKIEHQDFSVKLTNLVLERNLQQIQSGKIEIIASNLMDESIKSFIKYCAKQSTNFKGTCLTIMDSFWFNNNVGPEFFCMNLEYMKEIVGFHTERVFIVQNDNWQSEDKAKLDLIKLMYKNGMKCYVVNELDLESNIRDFCIFYAGNQPLIALEWNVDKNKRANVITIIYDTNSVIELEKEYARIWNESIPEQQSFIQSEVLNIPTDILGCKKYIRDLAIHYKKATHN